MQSRWQSLLEAKINLVLGFALSWAMYRWGFSWLFGISVSGTQAAGFTGVFALMSVVRVYFVRRLFVWIEEKSSVAGAEKRLQRRK